MSPLVLKALLGTKLVNIEALNYKANDDMFCVCHYGGELVLCDQCPASFHTQCLGIEKKHALTYDEIVEEREEDDVQAEFESDDEDQQIYNHLKYTQGFMAK